MSAAEGNSLVKGFNHTSYTISDDDFDRVMGLFTDGLGFPLLAKGPRDPKNMETVVGVPGADVIIAYVQAPNHRLEIINYLSPDNRKRTDQIRPCDTGFTHLAFDVTDIDKALSIANKYGFKEVHEPLPVSAGPNVGNFCVYTRDKNGMTIEYIGPRVS
ncbi:VOC family protein (plasmid) [Agrobacterium leguminum]|uniref:Glyoxalase/bleomycin resistance protein/dioxygenase superfamily protein n=1 Tax=Agrobacterium deltaense NCPPB 1641 TaxID=1183425 RepID=A0A1S7UB94_9HYPH|nr:MULTISPECIES: VOC family protein [Agrobacterium]WFS69768.1 VOC family protein [Agrobacterium leguminum]CVI64082.1 putative glyoxalase/bleomycin resistance protein/dioxygenase superfamily protein [Agrobacterium deltaense NCPPB 1641]